MTSQSKTKHLELFFTLTFLLLVFISGFRSIGLDRDSIDYAEYILNLTEYSVSIKEPTFLLIYKVSTFLFEDSYIRAIFIIYAILGIGINIYSILKISAHPIFSLFVYLLLFFVLHDMTQIRFGVACAIFLYAVSDIHEKKINSYILKILLAIAFHYSAIILLPLYFLKSNSIQKTTYIILPLIGLVFALVSINFSDIIRNNINFFPEFIGTKINIYFNIYWNDSRLNTINIFNSYNVFIAFFYFFSILNIEKFRCVYSILLVKILGWSLFSFYFLSFIPTVAFRLSGILSVVLIFLLPNALEVFSKKSRVIAGTILVILIFLHGINTVFIHELLNFNNNYFNSRV